VGFCSVGVSLIQEKVKFLGKKKKEKRRNKSKSSYLALMMYFISGWESDLLDNLLGNGSGIYL